MEHKPPITKADLKKAQKIATGPLMGSFPAKKPASAPQDQAKPAPLGDLRSVKARLGKLLDDQK